MRILLIQPPIEDFYYTPFRSQPLGLLYLAGVLLEEGFFVKILDSLSPDERGRVRKKVIEFPSDFSYLKKYYRANKSPFSLFSNFYHFGLDWEEIYQEVRKFKPALVGVSSQFSAYFEEVKKVCALVKKADKNIVVVVGGHHPTAMPFLVLKDKNIDFIIRGEAEFSFLKLCKSIQKANFRRLRIIEGIGYRKNRGFFLSPTLAKVENLNLLPSPPRELLNLRNYLFKNKVYTCLVSSRGCLFRCSFCEYSKQRAGFRYREPISIIKEMKYCYNLGVRHFDFEDDNINLNPEFEELLRLIIKKFSGKVSLSFMNGISTWGLSKRIIRLMREAGLSHIDLSLVSRSSQLRRSLQRKEDLRKFSMILNFFKEIGISCCTHFILGLPSQDKREVFSTLKFLASKPSFVGASVFYPVYNSKIFSKISLKYQRKGKFKFYRSSSFFYDKELSRDELASFLYFSRIINFIKSLCMRYNIKYQNFRDFLDEVKYIFRIRPPQIKLNLLIVDSSLEKDLIGAIILCKIFEYKKIYWVEKLKKENSVYYKFNEDFPSPSLTSEFIRTIDNLNIEAPSF